MTEAFETDGSTGRKRNSCKAVIVKDGKVLLILNRDDTGDFYLLPGGGQKFGETLLQAMQREVMEETGWVVEPGELILARDYVGANHEFTRWEADVHQTELMFMAIPIRMEEKAPEPDPWQIGVEWVEPQRLKNVRLYPSVLKEILPKIISGTYTGPIYLGDIN